MNPSTGRKKLNVHAARDGTAAGRYGGAPREHYFFSENISDMHYCIYSTVNRFYVDFQK